MGTLATHLVDLQNGGVKTVSDLMAGHAQYTAAAALPRLTPVFIDAFADIQAAQANVIATAECVGLLLGDSQLNQSVTVVRNGPIEGSVAEWTAVAGGTLLAGEEYVVDPRNSGRLITMPELMALHPVAGWSRSRVGRAVSSTTLFVSPTAPEFFDV